MVAVKGKLNPIRDRFADETKMSKHGEVKNFKIYVEVDKVKNADVLNNRTKRQSATLKSGGRLLSANDSRNGVKNLEKAKSKLDKSMGLKVGRKVLADIGNGNCSFSETQQGKSSKPGKGKGEMLLRVKKESIDLIRDTGDNQTTKKSVVKENVQTSSGEPTMTVQSRNSITTTVTGRKSFKGNVKTAFGEPRMKIQSRNSITTTFTGRKSIRENVVKGNAKTASDEPRMKYQSRNSVAATVTGRKSVRNPLLTRQSLPVLKQASKVETSGTAKENSEKSSNFRVKHGFPVNPSRRVSIAPKPSNPSSRSWRNRASDGFVVMASRAETKVDAGVISRKSIKPTVERTITALTTRRNLKSNDTFTTKKAISKPVDISKREEEKVFDSNIIPTVASQDESALDEGTSSDRIQTRKSDRRNSFTSSLVSRSKLLKQSTKVTTPIPLPEIYDDRNHLEVFDYVDDIYQYYWVIERQNPLVKNYLESQKDITPQMRGVLINWLIEVHEKFDLMEETLFLTVTLLDRYLSIENIKKSEMQLVGLTALLLASKYEDFWHPRVTDLISISAESYTRDQMLNMEKTILKKLKFRLNEPTPYVFMLKFLKAAQSDTKFERLAFYLIELCLVEHEALNYKPSMLCASAIYVARCTMQSTPRWTPLLAKHTRYEESEIRGCAEMILKFHKAAKTSLLRVTYEKYSSIDLSRVATMKPMARLP